MILQDNRETNETSWINIAKICSMGGECFNICKAIYFSLSYAFLSFYIKYLEISATYMNRWLCLAFIFVGPVILGVILKRVNDFF